VSTDGNKHKFVDKENGFLNVEAQVLVGCDGVHSTVRNLIKGRFEGYPSLQKFLNIHFLSK